MSASDENEIREERAVPIARASRRVGCLAVLIVLNGMMGLTIASFLFELKPERLVRFSKQRVAAQPAGPEKQQNERIIKELEDTLMQDPNVTGALIVVNGCLNALVIMGALRMVRTRSYGWGITVSIITLVPCLTGCCCSGPLIGIWGLVVLASPEVKAWLSPSGAT